MLFVLFILIQTIHKCNRKNKNVWLAKGLVTVYNCISRAVERIEMDLEKHIVDTIKEWQLKIGYREGNMKLYYPGASLVSLLELSEKSEAWELEKRLEHFVKENASKLGEIGISGSFDRYCLDIPAKGCIYVAEEVPEPVFLRRFLEMLTTPGNSMEQVRRCFAAYGETAGTFYREEMPEGHSSEHKSHVFYFEDEAVEEYVYWVEENEFGLSYHRFTREEYIAIRTQE